MHSLAFVVVLTISALAQATGQFRREPHVLTRAIDVLNQPDAPVELESATLNSGSPGYAMVRLRLRPSAREKVQLSGIVLRLAAGPLEHGIVTFRLRSRFPLPLSERSNSDSWGFAMFVPVPDDVPPDTWAISRDTRVLVAVEKVTDAAGRVVYDAPDSRELLWKRLKR